MTAQEILPPAPPAAPPRLAPLAELLASLGLVATVAPRLHLRFEPVRRFGRSAAREGQLVGVFVSWRPAQVAAGEAQHVRVLSACAAAALQRDCAALGLRYVDNLATARS